jgi:hypothetical protein
MAARISLGPCVKWARVRTVPTRRETVMAAGMPFPLTSPMTTRTPVSTGRIWKKSPQKFSGCYCSFACDADGAQNKEEKQSNIKREVAQTPKIYVITPDRDNKPQIGKQRV